MKCETTFTSLVEVKTKIYTVIGMIQQHSAVHSWQDRWYDWFAVGGFHSRYAIKKRLKDVVGASVRKMRYRYKLLNKNLGKKGVKIS